MDDLTLLKVLEPSSPSDDELAGVRDVVMNAVQGGRSRRPRRLVLVGGLVAAAVVAAVVAAIVVPSVADHGGAPAANADPATVLRAAAAASSALPDRVPRPDQFLYVKDGGGELWLSMDGTHDGGHAGPDGKVVAEPGCRHGVQLIPDGRSVPCTPDPAYVAEAPTTTPAMVGYLQRRFGAAGVNGVGKGILNLLEFHYLRPAARAALFDAATRLPGMRALTVRTVGRTAVGVLWRVCPSGTCGSGMLLFDRTTHAFLGVDTRGVLDEHAASAAPTFAVVDHVGQRP